MFNPQQYAVRIEHKLCAKGLAKSGDADLIRKDPMGFIDAVLKIYEKQSEEYELRSADFWDKYEEHKGSRLDEFGEESARLFAEDVVSLFD